MQVHHLQQANNLPAGATVYLVTKSHCLVSGIEALQLFIITPAQQPAFLKAYAGRIILSGSSVQEVLVKFAAS
jgi:hypothetical protein